MFANPRRETTPRRPRQYRTTIKHSCALLHKHVGKPSTPEPVPTHCWAPRGTDGYVHALDLNQTSKTSHTTQHTENPVNNYNERERARACHANASSLKRRDQEIIQRMSACSAFFLHAVLKEQLLYHILRTQQYRSDDTNPVPWQLMPTLPTHCCTCSTRVIQRSCRGESLLRNGIETRSTHYSRKCRRASEGHAPDNTMPLHTTGRQDQRNA